MGPTSGGGLEANRRPVNPGILGIVDPRSTGPDHSDHAYEDPLENAHLLFPFLAMEPGEDHHLSNTADRRKKNSR